MTERGDAPGPDESSTDPTAPPSAPEPPATAEPPGAGVPPAAPAPAPLVAWEAPPPFIPPAATGGSTGYAGGPPPFTIGALLADCFAIYAADPLRFIAVSIVTSVVSFLGSFSSNPFDPTSATAGASGLLGVLGFVLGIVGGAVLLALADGGPTLAFGPVVRRGVERAGWLFLTSLVLGIGAIVILIVPIIVIVVTALASPPLALLLMLVLMVAFIWFGLRVALAIPATVVDNLNSIDAIRLAWRVTKPVGVWARVLGAGLLLGLMFVPAYAGLGFAAAISMLGGQPGLLLAFSLGLALFTPIASLLTYAAYRRLVAPIAPWWVERASPPAHVPPIDAPPAPIDAPPAPIDAPAPPIDAPVPPIDVPPPPPDAPAPLPVEASAAAVEAPDDRPVFRPRPFEVVAKTLLVVLLAIDLLGIVAAGWAIGELAAGHVRLPAFPRYPGAPTYPGFPGSSDAVEPGTVAFGTAADLDTCTVSGQDLAFDASTPIVWMAAFDDRITTADEVFLHVTVDGDELEMTLQDRGTYDCLGSDVPASFDAGIYVFELIVNGQTEASGIVFVQ